jgi:type I restriction enzyme S subunit
VIENSDIPEGYEETELGVLPKEWDICSLNQTDYFEFENGIWKGTKGELVDCNILRNTNFLNDGTLNYSDVASIPIEKRHIIKKQLKPGDIIIERSGGGPSQPVGRVVFFERDSETFCFSNFTSRLRVIDQKKVDSRFLHQYLFYFHSIGKTNELQQRTTGIRNLMFEDYKKSIIPLPPLPEQHAIATTLRTVQEAKEKTDDVIAATKVLKAAMMKHLFKYGPVSPEDTERVALKETDIGQVPKEWKVVKIGDIIQKTQYGLSIRGEQVGQYPILRMNNLGNGLIDTNDLQYVNIDENNLHNFQLNRGDILFNRTNSYELVGKTSIFNLDKTFVFASYLVRIIPDFYKLFPEYLNYYLNWGETQARLKLLASRGVSQSNINATKLRDFSIPFPSLSIQKQIATILTAIDQKLAAEQSRKEALDILFASLLHDLMTAKVRVKDFRVEASIKNLT